MFSFRVVEKALAKQYLGERIFLLITFRIGRNYVLNERLDGGSDCTWWLGTIVSQVLSFCMHTVAFAASKDLGKMLWLPVANGPLVITQVEVLGLSFSTFFGCCLVTWSVIVPALSFGYLGDGLRLFYWLLELMVCDLTSCSLKWSSNLG